MRVRVKVTEGEAELTETILYDDNLTIPEIAKLKLKVFEELMVAS